MHPDNQVHMHVFQSQSYIDNKTVKTENKGDELHVYVFWSHQT